MPDTSRPSAAEQEVNGLEDTVSPVEPGLEDTVAALSSDPSGTLTDHRSDGGSGPVADPITAELRVIERVHYQVDGELARGGMGRIMRARDTRHGRVVALKESLRREPTLLARFTREAMITARLQHPGIVPVYEAGKWQSGDPFFAMKMVDGTSLSNEIDKRETLDQRMELLPNLLAVVDALAYAHTSGVIHRDLKPSNVLIGSFGETVVIDWGLAKVMDDADGDDPLAPLGPGLAGDSPDLTAAGHVIGTPVYMAPEQASGAAVDQRADVYSLGAIAYHLLTGKAPYQGDSSADVLDLVLEGPPRPVRERESCVPADLAAIVDKAMARDPSERYPCARELAEDLRRFQTGQLVSTHAYSLRDHLVRFLGRHRAAVAVAAVMLLCMLGLGAFAVSQIVDERNTVRKAWAEAERQGAIANQQRERAESLNAEMLAMIDKFNERTGENMMRDDMAKKLLTYYQDPASADPQHSDGLEPAARMLHLLAKQPHMEGKVDVALKLYQKSQDFAERLATKKGASPELTRIMAENHARIAHLLIASGDLREARHEYLQAIARFEDMAASGQGDGDMDAYLSHLYSQVGLLDFLAGDEGGWHTAYDKSREHARASHVSAPVADRGPDTRFHMSVTGDRSMLVTANNASAEAVSMAMHQMDAELDGLPGDLAALGGRARVSPVVHVVSGDPTSLAQRSNAPASVGLVLAFEDLDEQLEAMGQGEKSIDIYSKLASVLHAQRDELDDAPAMIRAEVFLKLADKLAKRDRAQAAEYAGQCVDLLEKEQAQAGPQPQVDDQLRRARALLQHLHGDED